MFLYHLYRHRYHRVVVFSAQKKKTEKKIQKKNLKKIKIDNKTQQVSHQTGSSFTFRIIIIIVICYDYANDDKSELVCPILHIHRGGKHHLGLPNLDTKRPLSKAFNPFT